MWAIEHAYQLSLSARRAWIEIVITAMTSQISVVALRKESVDRNLLFLLNSQSLSVALRKESVDRNSNIFVKVCYSAVALRKESVDRNKRAEPSGQAQCRRSPQGERG